MSEARSIHPRPSLICGCRSSKPRRNRPTWNNSWKRNAIRLRATTSDGLRRSSTESVSASLPAIFRASRHGSPPRDSKSSMLRGPATGSHSAGPPGKWKRPSNANAPLRIRRRGTFRQCHRAFHSGGSRGDGGSQLRGLNDFRRKPPRAKATVPDYTTSSDADIAFPDDLAAIYDISPLYTAGYDGTGRS